MINKDMEKRTARITLLIDPTKKQIIEEICTMQDLNSSQVIRQLIRDYIQQNASAEQLARMPHHAR